MFLVKFYTIQLLVFSSFSNTSYAMVERTGKANTNVRTSRQIRPILGSIVFLLAANLVAKGALGFGGYQGPAIPNNIQGSLYLNLNGGASPNWQSASQQPQPQQQQQQQQPQQLLQQLQYQQHVPYQPVWFPIQNNVPYANGPATQEPLRPITQQQIVNMRDPYYPEEEFQELRDTEPQQIIINKTNALDSISSASAEVPAMNTSYKESRDDSDLEIESTTSKTTMNEGLELTDVEILPHNFTEASTTTVAVTTELARQVTTRPTTTRRPTRPTMRTTTIESNLQINSTDYNYTVDGYGPSNGNENISITYAPPTGVETSNITGNVSATLQPPSAVQNGTNTTATSGPGYYYPSGNYGPSNGNENISITYGSPAYQKPFSSSPEDPYLNTGNQNYGTNFNNYENNGYYYNQFPELFKYNNIVSRFYNKYDYHYPSFYGNYLGK